MFPVIAVLEKCLLGCADRVVSVYGERSPQNSSVRLLVYWKVCSEGFSPDLGEKPSELW